MIPLAQPPLYPRQMTQPMEAELVRAGVKPLHSVEEVHRAFAQKEKTTLFIVNSVCGCAAGSVRPGIALAMKHSRVPAHAFTVFAGVDREATQEARARTNVSPSSPSIFLFKNGACVFSLQRFQLEGQPPERVAELLMHAFDEFCDLP